MDFAYLIHTEVGAECTGAKVNGKIVPLAHELKTGDTVEIVTTKGHTPSPDWLAFVKTVKARTKIRALINAREKERSYSLGKEMCEKLFRKKNQNFNALIKSGHIKEVADTFGFKSVDDLIAHVGFGKLTPMQVLNKALPHLEKGAKKRKRPSSRKVPTADQENQTPALSSKGSTMFWSNFPNAAIRCRAIPSPGISPRGRA